MNKAEIHFEEKRIAINKAETVDEMIHIYCDDVVTKDLDGYIRDVRKRINKLFKGNLEKVRQYFIKEFNEFEHTYFN